MSQQIILLNSDFSFLNTINWKKAMKLIVKEKAEIIKETSKILSDESKTWKIAIPKVMRLIKLVKTVYKNKIPYSKRNVLTRDRYICQYCGIKKQKLTVDHVLPSSRGGKSTFQNCVACCQNCNTLKNNMTPKESNMPLLRIPFEPTIMQFITIKMKVLGIDKELKDIWGRQF